MRRRQWLLALTVLLGAWQLAFAGSSNADENSTIARAYLGSLGTPEFAKVADASLAEGHKLLRHEFENLKYNADDPLLGPNTDPVEQAISDRRNEIVHLIVDGDLVAARLQVRGVHSGNLFGIPATGKAFDISAGAVLRMRDGKIVESWFMAEEARLLRQLGVGLPERQDGGINLPPAYDDSGSFDEAFRKLEESPEETPEYHHKRLMLAYKAREKPSDYSFSGRPYSNLRRGGIANIVERANELGIEGSFGSSMSNREDRLAYVASERNLGMMAFRLTAQHTGLLYGIPASGHALNFWELSFAEFDGETWSHAWWMADELGFLLTIGSDEALDFLVSDE